MIDTELYDAISALNDGDDAHWNKEGQPNLNVLKEATGHFVSRETQEDAYDRHRVTADNDDAESASQDGVDNVTISATQDDEADQDHDQRPGHGGQFISLGAGRLIRVSQS